MRLIGLAVVLTLSLTLAPLAAEAQPTGKVYRIGFLGNSTAALETHLVGPFRDGLRDLGYLEGRNALIEYRWAEGQYERFPALIAELIALKVDVIVTAGTPATQAVKTATTSVPLVMIAVGDPVATGIVASLRQPGGNITGLTSIAEETESKRLELLREILPKVSHVAILSNPENQSAAASLSANQAAARRLGMRVQVFEARVAGALDETLKAIVTERPGALLVIGDRLFLHNRQRIVDFANKNRVPMVPVHPELVEAGALMSFGPSYVAMHRRAAYFVDKILKGVKPGELPVERPTTFELVINRKTAKALGLTIPPLLLMRADRLIE
jgi:putative ABC transport system substrate-binding protein